MSEENLGDVPEYYTPEEMDRVVDRLARADWLTGNQFVDAKGVSIWYSEKGSERMKTLVKILDSHGFLAANQKQVHLSLDFMLELFLAAPELGTPPYAQSDGEGNALLCLILAYHIEHMPGRGDFHRR
jgi:hypothetical protein